MTQSHRNDYGIDAFARLAALPEGDIDLARAAFHIAGAEYPDLDLEDQLGLRRDVSGRSPSPSPP